MTKLMTAGLLLICATAGAAELPDYRIGIDDVLEISVWNVAELQQTVTVRPDGKVSLPLVNDIVAAGLTPMELRSVLAKAIATYVQNPDVSVIVREIRSLKVSVLGQVRQPGRYAINGTATVLDALALAGGFTEFASRRRITVLRNAAGETERLRFDYDAAIARGANLRVEPGDIVVVP